MAFPPAPPYDESADAFAVGPPGPAHAAWGNRLGAAVIDFFVRFAILAACVVAGTSLYLTGGAAGEIGIGAGLGVGVLVTWFVYAPLMMARTDGQTVGHRATRTRVVMADGSRMSGGRAFVREALVKGLLIETAGAFTLYVLPLINYLFALWDPHHEALHDKLCSTRVVPA